MDCFLVRNTVVSSTHDLRWLIANAHRLTCLKYEGSDQGKLIALFKDGSTFHAYFLSYRSMVSWLFHPQFADRKLSLFGINGIDSANEWHGLDSNPKEWLTTGSAAHWDLLSKIMGK